MKDYAENENTESPNLEYCNEHKLYGWVMSRPFPVTNFETIKDSTIKKNYNEESEKGYFIENDVRYIK